MKPITLSCNPSIYYYALSPYIYSVCLKLRGDVYQIDYIGSQDADFPYAHRSLVNADPRVHIGCMSKTAPSMSVPKSMQARYDQVVALTDDFSRKHLNDEYAELARRMAAALCRKRPSPLTSGQPRTWACGILHTLGQINFLSDPATEPHMTMAEMSAAFGVGQSTTSAKAAVIRNAITPHHFDPKWSLRSLTDKNPLLWMLEINGILVDIRNAPPDIQELALAQGLIPYLPDDKP